MADLNIHQVFVDNPITTNASTDLMYFGQSPYTSGADDAAMTFANFAAQFAEPLPTVVATSVLCTDSMGNLYWTSMPDTGYFLQSTPNSPQVIQQSQFALPAGALQVNRLLYCETSDLVGMLVTADSGVLITDNTGAPGWLANSSTPGYVLTANSGAPPSWQVSAVTPIAVQYSVFNIGTDFGAANTYEILTTPAIVTLDDGLAVRMVATQNANTTTSTLMANGTPEPIVNLQGAALSGGEILAGFDYDFIWNGANSWWVLQNSSLAGGGVTAAQIQAQSFTYAVDTGTTNIIQASYSPAVTSVPDGSSFWFKAANSNTGASSFNPNISLFASKAILNKAGAGLVAGDILFGLDYQVVWNNALNSYVLQNSSLSSGVTAAQVQQQAFTSGADSGTADAYIVTLSPTLVSYTNNMLVEFTPANTNLTNTPTLSAGGLGAHAITSGNGTLLNPSDLLAGTPAICVYNTASSNWQLLNPQTFSAQNIQAGFFISALDEGAPDAYSVTLNPSDGVLADDQIVIFTPNTGNTNLTSTPTLAVNGVSPITIVGSNQSALVPSDIVAGIPAVVVYSATNTTFELINPQGNGTFQDISGSVTVIGLTGSSNFIRQSVNGKIVTLSFDFAGTASGTTFTVSGLPKAALNELTVPISINDNSVPAIGQVQITSSGTTMTFYNTPASTTWTPSGAREASGTITYESV